MRSRANYVIVHASIRPRKKFLRFFNGIFHVIFWITFIFEPYIDFILLSRLVDTFFVILDHVSIFLNHGFIDFPDLGETENSSCQRHGFTEASGSSIYRHGRIAD